jgi:glycosyltransferase involved in cell wall biosynthesis
MVALSVVVAAHRVAPYLPACLDSILAGSPEAIQVIGVDDASPDECGAILDDCARRDARFRAVHLDQNGGLGAARNAGLDEATGEFVWFVDGDDVLAPGAVAAVLHRLRTFGPDVLLLRHAWMLGEQVARDPHAVYPPSLPDVTSVIEQPALLRVRQAAWNRVVRRDLAKQPVLRFPSGWYEDVGFSQLCLVAAERVGALGQLAYLYRQRDGAITATLSPRHFDVFAQYERLFEALLGWPAGEAMRPHLFELMIEHYLVIVGTDGRIPDAMRGDFFARIVEHYHRYLPPGGYALPGGINGVKHRFVRWDSYGLFRTVRNAYRAGRKAQQVIEQTMRGARRDH